jgi:exonuclease SbcC
MQLHHLKLTNFRQHADTDLVLGPGITAIIGPNGAGKTTLLEAIAWVFYGNPAARGSRDSIRWTRAPARSQVRVEVSFSLGAHEYTVVRTTTGAELFQDGAGGSIANSHQSVTAAVTRILGMSREEFFRTYFTGQKELAVMAAMRPAERGRFLSQVLGYERLKLAQDALRERRTGLRGELAGLEQGLVPVEELERERVDAETRLREATEAVRRATATKVQATRTLTTEGPLWTRMVEVRESVLSLDGERRVAEHNVIDARREFERLDRDLAEALAAQAELRTVEAELAPVTGLRAELAGLEKESRAAGRRRELSGQLEEIRAHLGRLDTRLTEMGDPGRLLAEAEVALEAARRDLARAQEDEERAHTAWVRDQQDAASKRQALLDQHRDVREHRERIVQAGPDGLCPTCGRPLGAAYETMLATLSRQLEEIEINGKYFRQRVDQLTAEPDEVREALRRRASANARVEAAVQAAAQWRARGGERAELMRERDQRLKRAGDLEREVTRLPDAYDAARHEAVGRQLKELEPRIQLATRLQVRAERAESLVKEAEAAERRLSERETKVRQLIAAIADSGFSEERYREARARYEAAERALQVAEVEVASVQGERRAAEGAVESAARRRQERAVRAERIDRLKVEVRLHDELDAAFGDLRTDLIAQMRPDLSEVASEFLVDLTDGRYSELDVDEEYGITLMEGEIPKPVISGGEEDVANLALRLAISQMVAERAGQPLSLLVLDEIFGSLDEARREHVVELLRRLGDRFPQVVLITHIESVRERVDRVLRVEFDAARGASVVTEDQGGFNREDVAP